MYLPVGVKPQSLITVKQVPQILMVGVIMIVKMLIGVRNRVMIPKLLIHSQHALRNGLQFESSLTSVMKCIIGRTLLIEQADVDRSEIERHNIT